MKLTTTPIGRALALLTHDELYVIASLYWGELTETAIAAELSELRRLSISRDWVHRRRLTAEARMRRELVALEVAA